MGKNSRASSIKSNLRFFLSGSEDELSLERIHTFNLKNEHTKKADISSMILDSKSQNSAKFHLSSPPTSQLKEIP